MKKEICAEEKAYRRGYAQGFYNARHPENSEISYQDVLKWRYDEDEACEFPEPPGSPNIFVPRHFDQYKPL